MSDSESDYAPVAKKKTSAAAKKPAAAAPKRAPAKKKPAMAVSSGDDDSGDDDGSGDEAPAPKARAGTKKKVEDIYKKTNLREHILKRPDSYIGTIEQETDKIFVLGDDGLKFVHRDVTYVPGMLKIFDEILVNAADNKQRDPRGMTELRVDVDPALNRIAVFNNGRGIPIEIHNEFNIYVPELIFGQLLTSSNYDDDEKRTVGGRNGFGAKLANIFSKEFIVETCDGRKYYKQVFSKNMSDKSEPQIGPPPGGIKEPFTRITFVPDLARFGMTELDNDIIALIQRRTYDIAGTSGSGLKVYYNKKRLAVKDFKSFCQMHLQNPDDLMFETINDRWEVAIAPADQFTQVSFVNRIATLRGGTHVNAIVDQVSKTLAEVVGKKSKKVQLKPQHIKQHLWVFVNALVENPTFDTQTKVNLTSKRNTFGSSPDLSEAFTKRVGKSAIVSAILSFAQFQADKELKKNDAKKKTSRLLGIPKLEDANMAGTRQSSKCTLIITEGDSAKALAMSGLSVVGRDFFGVFPIRGKLLNVRDASTKSILENAEITHLKQIIGLQQGRNYTDVSALRYGHIMIMTDQDHDGSHIKGLIINMFAYFWPSLLKMPGFLTEFITPIVKVSQGKTANAQRNTTTFYTIPEYEEWLEEHNQGKGWNVKYYKGLGTSSSAEAKIYFTNIDTHQIPFSYRDERCTKLIEMLFSKATADERKHWLASYVPGTYLNHAVSQIHYQDFINKELILFSIASNQRAIPSIIDGLKPGQRKVLFACFKRNLRKELKVAQLAGYVAEQSAYHHGEASLAGTIVALAQNYVGANNINYLWPSGQFGTRASGGKDAASPRYIFTYLSPITRVLFNALDDPLLNYLQDDGQHIEPDFYVPILPTVLINGSNGIGTGWSSDIANHNPRELVANIRRMLDGEEPEEMHPWYKGFIGQLSQRRNRPGAYAAHGLCDIIHERPCTVHIYELPIGTWTSNYKTDFLEVLLKEGRILELSEYHTDTTVSFLVTFSEPAWTQAISGAGGVEASLRTFLKLQSSLSSTNMVLFNKDGKLHRYDTTGEILKEFFPIRLELYQERKRYLMDTIGAELRKIDNKVRFILYVIEEKIKMRNIKRADLLKVLRDFKFDPILNDKANKPASLVTGTDAGQDDEQDDDEASSTATGSAKVSAAVHSVNEGLRGYTYLTSMPLLSLTYEKVQELLKEKSAKEEELAVIKGRSAEEMWNLDLDAFEVALDEHEEMEAAELRAGENAKYGATGGPSRGKKSASRGKKLADSDDDYDDDDDSDGDWGGAKKKKKPAAKKATGKNASKQLNIPDFILEKFKTRPSEQSFTIEEETEADKKKRLRAEAAVAAKMTDVADLLGLGDLIGDSATPEVPPKPKKVTAAAAKKAAKATMSLDSDSEAEVKPKRGARAAATAAAPKAKATAAAAKKAPPSKARKQSLDDFDDDMLGSTSDDSDTEDGFNDFNSSGDDDDDDDGSGSDSGSDSDKDRPVAKRAAAAPTRRAAAAAPRGPTKRQAVSGSESDDDSSSESDVKPKRAASAGAKKARKADYDDDESDQDMVSIGTKRKPAAGAKKKVVIDSESEEDTPPPAKPNAFAAALMAKAGASQQRNILEMMGANPSASAAPAPATTNKFTSSLSAMKKTKLSLDSDSDDDLFISKPKTTTKGSAVSVLNSRFSTMDSEDEDDFAFMPSRAAGATSSTAGSSFINKTQPVAAAKSSKYSMYDSDSD